MSDREMLTGLSAAMLAEAFPMIYNFAAASAGEAVARALASGQWTERFTVQSEGQTVLIPARLRFANEKLQLAESDEGWRFARALQTRSNDGFERQRAARDLLVELEPWGAPFIVALIGEYIVEILDDIAAGLTPEVASMLGSFIRENDAYWQTTKRRVSSYWNVYYRWNASSERRRPYRREEYIGFHLIELLEKAATRNS